MLIVNVLKCHQEVQTIGMTCHAINLREPAAKYLMQCCGNKNQVHFKFAKIVI